MIQLSGALLEMLAMGILFDRICANFECWDVVEFQNIHHEDYMVVKETGLLDKDEHTKVISELAPKDDWNWHKIAKCTFENQYVLVCTWEEDGEIVNNVSTIINSQLWRTIISRVPKL